MRNARKGRLPLNSREAIETEILRLSDLPVRDLRDAWELEFRRPTPKGLWRDLLLRSLVWRLQERAFGGHDKATLKLLAEYGRRKPGDVRCQALKAGTVLVREFAGSRHTVTIAPKGFVWQDKTYSSLSAIARIITGTNWNGPRFFGLRETGRRKDAQQQSRAA